MWKKVLIIISSCGAFLICVGILALALYSPRQSFNKDTSIEGINVSGMNNEQALGALVSKISQDNSDALIRLEYEDNIWEYTGESIELSSNAEEIVDNHVNKNFLSKLTNRKSNKDLVVGYRLKDIDSVVEEVASSLDSLPLSADISYDKTSKTFSITDEQVGKTVDKEMLASMLSEIQYSKVSTITIPVTETEPDITKDDLARSTRKQSEFSTNYSKSAAERKNNISIAVSKLDGMKINPQEEFSFNLAIGERTAANGYQEANIIKDGTFVKGTGGGVCQVSTTLYNALLLAGVDITEVHKHSLAVSYVPLAFDAMVSWGYSDLKFVNNTDVPIFLLSSADGDTVKFTVYGDTLQEGEEIKRRADFVGTIPHTGDKVVPDVNGEYSDKIMFKGEYIRIKYPQEGYESNAYLQYYKDGVLQEEKLIRHEKYAPQEGLVYEGTEDLPQGMTLPKNTVSIIPPQTQSVKDKSVADNSIVTKNPVIYNP